MSLHIRGRRFPLRCPGSRLGRLSPARIGLIPIISVVIIYAATVGNAVSDDFSTNSRFFQTLSAPMTSIVDGKPFRAGLEGIAAQAGLNLWLDRRVDPSALIDAGPVGPTVFAAIQKLAGTKDCVAMPIANFVLVGRQSWVDLTASSLISLSPQQRGEPINVSWGELTTPADALKLVARGSHQGLPTLPHDLWPGVVWKDVHRQVGLILILSQFEPQAGNLGGKTGPQPAHTRRYSPARAVLPLIRDAMSATDGSSRVRVSSDWVVAKGTVAAHRAATLALLAAAENVAPPDPDTDTFTLKKLTTSAENALNQLARSAQKTCVIKPEAREACSAVINVEGKDVTLRQLIDMIAKQAGVVATWQGDSIVISIP